MPLRYKLRLCILNESSESRKISSLPFPEKLQLAEKMLSVAVVAGAIHKLVFICFISL